MKLLRIIFIAIFSMSLFNTQAQEQLMGEVIRSQAFDNIGTFDFPGISCKPLGVAYLFGNKFPDLFLRSDKWYPGFYYYKFESLSSDSVPIFSKAKEFSAPVSCTSCGCLLIDKNIYGFWYIDGKIILTILNPDSFEFIKLKEIEIIMPRNPDAMYVKQNKAGDFVFIFSIGDGTRTKALGDWRKSDYIPYSPEGVYNGKVSYSHLYKIKIRQDFNSVKSGLTKISLKESKVRFGHQNITEIEINDELKGLITGSRFGNLNFHALTEDLLINEESMAVGIDLIALRHPTINPTPLSYPGMDGKWNNLIVAGEGGIYYYKYLGFSEKRNVPVYDSPKMLLKQNSNVKGGSLVVPTLVDWDSDGNVDIVSGNSQGQILFFKNVGNNQMPQYIHGKEVHAGGKAIHIQPGYGEDIQGSGESRWGYTCPNIVDWNQDGLYDIVMGDSRGKHTVYINIGMEQKPVLAHEQPIYLEGLELHGTWRCKPGVALINDKMVYITLDDDDEFHLYWQVDAYNLKEGFKLRLENGKPIKANFLQAGGTGRLKFNVLDWDIDGVLDLIVGTPRHGCVPNPKNGLPWTYSQKERLGASVLFLKNIGTDETPIYQFPKLLKYKGKPLSLGQHSCAPTPWYKEGNKAPGLMVGRENGMFFLFDRKYISW